MGSIIFVYGPGVRQAGYEKTYKILESKWSKKKGIIYLTNLAASCVIVPLRGDIDEYLPCVLR